MDRKRIKKHLALGILGAVVTVVGELLQGAVAAPEAGDEMARLFSTIAVLPVWRIGLGSSLGGLGILMQWFGFQGICLSFADQDTRLAKAFRVGNVGFTVIGAMVHILMSVWMHVIKFSAETEAFTLWFLVPIVAIFFAVYGLFAVSMFVQFWKKNTIFPRWCAFLNPILGKAVINGLTAVLPNTALCNGIGFADMGLTSLVTFTVLYILCRERD